jgi:hypothetical protein
MRIRNLLAVGALMSVGLALPCAAQSGCEDCSITFALNSTDRGIGTIDGTLTLDTTTDLFNGADLTLSSSSIFPNGTFTIVGSQKTQGDGFLVDIDSHSVPEQLELFLPAPTLAGYDGSSVSVSLDSAFNESGSLEPMGGTSVTPEPGGLLLLATGLVGLAGLMWRRFAAV